MIAALIFAVAPLAEPTYLRCTFPSNNVVVMITADEANSSVTVALPSTGFTRKFGAAFTATEVRFQDSDLSYIVSRTDLSVVRTIKLIKSTDKGQCAVEKAPPRAF